MSINVRIAFAHDRPIIRSIGERCSGLNAAARDTPRQNLSRAARAPSARPRSHPSTKTAAFMAPAEVPEIAAMWSQSSSSNRSSTPQVNAPWEPPPCRARSISAGSRSIAWIDKPSRRRQGPTRSSEGSQIRDFCWQMPSRQNARQLKVFPDRSGLRRRRRGKMRNAPPQRGEEARQQTPPAGRCQAFSRRRASPRGWCVHCRIFRLLDGGCFPTLRPIERRRYPTCRETGADCSAIQS